MAAEPLGAYGLRLSGPPGIERSLVPAVPEWPGFTIVIDVGAVRDRSERVDDHGACLKLRTGGWIDLNRDIGVARFVVPNALSADEVVHPYLAPVGAVSAHWFGRESFHGGGVVHSGAAWGVLGEREDGKSSLLAACAERGIDIVCDDVLVVDGARAFAGPRTIDLRREAAEALELGEPIGVVGARERWRLGLGPLPATLPLAGWVFVAWDDVTAVRRVSAPDALTRLLRHRGVTIPPVDPAAFLQLSTLPAWELRRPRSWDALPEALERLFGVLGPS